MDEVDYLVVGGGVVGMLSALMLAEPGQRVALVERGCTGREASWAGGGIVSPLYPWRYSSAVSALACWSQGFYPQLAEKLFEQTGFDAEVYVSGLYWLDLTDEASALAWSIREGRELRKVDKPLLYGALPGLGDGFDRGVHMPSVANVRNPRLLKALHAALLKLPNVTLHEHCEVSGFILEEGVVRGVHTGQGEIRAEQVVLAAGAWSGLLLAGLGIELPVEPVKGQMILYRCAEDFLPSMVLAKGRYAIPRRDGHILIGSTLEFEGFDKTPTRSARDSLEASAIELLPALAQAEVVGQWAGLRPGSPEGIPFIGPVPGVEGLWLNCGHYRNGLVLAPASCRLLSDLLLGREPIVDPRPYAPDGRLAPLERL